MRKDAIKIISYKGEIASEVRPLFFLKAFGLPVLNARIVSFGKCNFACPYCKRDGQFRDKNGDIINTVDVTFEKIRKNLDGVTEPVIRFSGGDPVMYRKAVLELSRELKDNYLLSMAHNGSSVSFATEMSEFLHSAAIDLKGVPENLFLHAGISQSLSKKMYKTSLQVQKVLADAGVFVDVRTPIFGHTTLEQLLRMAEDISKHGREDRTFWTLRLYRAVRGCDWLEGDQKRTLEMISLIKESFPHLKMGLRAKWMETGFLYF